MKQYELIQIAKYLNQFSRIHSIARVDDTVLRLRFDRDTTLYVSLHRGDSHWFVCDSYERARPYTAPFDILLGKFFNNARFEKAEVEEGNRIMRLHVTSRIAYRADAYTLQLEFTGRNTNAIILDTKGIVQEALRHIDGSVSFRSVRVGEPLLALPPREFNETAQVIIDMESYLKGAYLTRKTLHVERVRNTKLAALAKKIAKLERTMEHLEDEKELQAKSIKLANEGSLILANLNQIPNFSKEVKIDDFDGNPYLITLPKEARNPQEAANILYAQSKKLRQKAASMHIERENLESKHDFLLNLQSMVQKSESVEALHILMPRQTNSKRREKDNPSYESFTMEGYKIMVGKNEKGNIALLKEAKKSDLWLHVKDIPSAHVIIRTDKQSVHQNVLEFAGRLCVGFSKLQAGGYLVDYTPRRNVRMGQGANVTYVDYQTLKIFKE
jgi:predicted ribosome quality control (RQC) complex YloA/Tae2 family protein